MLATLALTSLAMAQAPSNEASAGTEPLTFERLRDQPRWFLQRGDTWGYVIDKAKKGADRYLVAVTPDKPLTPLEFAARVGVPSRFDRAKRAKRTQQVLLYGQMGTLLAGILMANSEDPSVSRSSIPMLGLSIGLGVGGLIAFGQSQSAAKMKLPEAQSRVEAIGATATVTEPAAK